MSKILQRPEGPVSAFFKYAGGTVVLVGIPAFARVLGGSEAGEFHSRLPTLLAVLGSMSVVVGTIAAIWALVRRWAYDKVTTKEEAW